MKKTLLSLAVCATLAFGMGDKTAEVIEPSTLEKEINNAKKPKKENMEDLLQKAKREMEKKAKSRGFKIKVYTATASVDASPDDSQYFDYLTSAYNQAVLELKAQMVLAKAGKVAINEAYKYHKKTIPDDMLQKELEKQVNSELDELESNSKIEDIFGLVTKVINKALGEKPEEEKKKFEAEVSQNIFNKAFTEGFTKEGFDSIQGLIPYENFIITSSENGEIEIGVLAYTTQKSLQLARDLAAGKQSAKIEDAAQCKSAEDIVDVLEDEQLTSTFGLKFFYNENCRPALIAYGIDSFIKEDGMNADYRGEAKERARGMADKFISNFLNSNVDAFIKDTKVQQKTVDAMKKAARQDGKTTMGASKKERGNAIIKEMSKDFASSSSMNLIGLEDARTWNVDFGDSEVVGVIRYYSMDSINAANDSFTLKEEKPKKIKTQAGVKRTTNIEVDDF